MREELFNAEWHCYGLSTRDIKYTIRLTKDMISSRLSLHEIKAEEIREEQPEVAEDILDDVNYYLHIDIYTMWEYCLWRLQGILEGIIMQDYLSELSAKQKKSLNGLYKKIEKLDEVGYKLTQDNVDELFKWNRLRNALSHYPPEQYRPSDIEEKDILEYSELIIKFLEELEKQKKD